MKRQLDNRRVCRSTTWRKWTQNVSQLTFFSISIIFWIRINGQSYNCAISLPTAESHVSSEPMIADMAEDMAGALDDYEPEAIIVDIEDVIEETASPLSNVQPHQTPIYSVATSETTSIAVPLGTVTASHQPSPVLLVEAGESCPIPARVVDADIKSEVDPHMGLTISHKQDTESFWKKPT